MSRIILKLSGEALKGNKESGIDYDVVLGYAKEIKKVYDLNKYGIGIIIGGGNFFRGRDAMKAGLNRVDCDYMGMMGTILNSVAMKDVLETIGVEVALAAFRVGSVADACQRESRSGDDVDRKDTAGEGRCRGQQGKAFEAEGPVGGSREAGDFKLAHTLRAGEAETSVCILCREVHALCHIAQLEYDLCPRWNVGQVNRER